MALIAAPFCSEHCLNAFPCLNHGCCCTGRSSHGDQRLLAGGSLTKFMQQEGVFLSDGRQVSGGKVQSLLNAAAPDQLYQLLLLQVEGELHLPFKNLQQKRLCQQSPREVDRTGFEVSNVCCIPT